jgi:hypothetical protein
MTAFVFLQREPNSRLQPTAAKRPFLLVAAAAEPQR